MTAPSKLLFFKPMISKLECPAVFVDRPYGRIIEAGWTVGTDFKREFDIRTG